MKYLILVLFLFYALSSFTTRPKEVQSELNLANVIELPYRIYAGREHSKYSDTLPKDDISNELRMCRSEKFASPVWLNIQRTKAHRLASCKQNRKLSNGEKNYINAQLLGANGERYFIVDVVTSLFDYYNHTLFSIDRQGCVIDKLEVGTILDRGVAVKNALLDTDTTITIYALEVLNRKSAESVPYYKLIFQARRIDTKYTISKDGRFQKINRIVYKPQQYEHSRFSGTHENYKFEYFNVDQGSEIPLREIKY